VRLPCTALHARFALPLTPQGVARHHVFLKTSHREVQLAEVGPRFEMRPYEIRQGTLEQSEADVEWVLRPFMKCVCRVSRCARGQLTSSASCSSGRKKNQL
jgi:hypothetical protein